VTYGEPVDASSAVLDLAGSGGVLRSLLPILTGLEPGSVASALAQLGDSCLTSGARVFGPAARREAEGIALKAVDEGHAEHPLEEAVPVAAVRKAFSRSAADELPDAAIQALLADGRLEPIEGGVRRRGYRPTLSGDQEAASSRLHQILHDGGLDAPSLDELPEDLRTRADLWALLRRLESLGFVRQVSDDLFFGVAALDAAAARIRAALGGQRDLGPTDFREVLPVTRKRLLPLLSHFDQTGTTVRRGDGRDVPLEG
jgi:hypothetical protein